MDLTGKRKFAFLVSQTSGKRIPENALAVHEPSYYFLLTTTHLVRDVMSEAESAWPASMPFTKSEYQIMAG